MNRATSWEREPLDVARGAKHVILLDLDNWSRVLLLPVHELLPVETVLIGFAGDRWLPPRDAHASMDAMAQAGRFALRRCGPRKDAADFQIVSFFTTLDRKLPRHVPMTIVSPRWPWCGMLRRPSARSRSLPSLGPPPQARRSVRSGRGWPRHITLF